jgi:hypothetical protein
MSGTCQAETGLYLGGTVPVDESLAHAFGCDQPATVTLRAGCIHEHVREKRFCAGHGEVNPADALWFCRECAEAGHDCPIMPVVVTR